MSRPPQTPLADLEARVRHLKATIGRQFFELGEVLAEIRAGARHHEAGFSNFKAYVVDQLDISSATAFAALAIHEHFSPAIAHRYGRDKLEAGLAWMRATPDIEQAGDIIAADLRLRDTSGRFVSKPFHEATAKEIRAARALLLEDRRGRDVPDDGLQSRLDAFVEALPGAPARLQRNGRVQFKRHGGRDYLSFHAIPVEQLGEVAELLRQMAAADE